MADEPDRTQYLTLPITATTVELFFKDGEFLILPPHVFVTVHGAPTDVDVQFPMTAVPGAGEVYTKVVYIFKQAAVGKKFTTIIRPE